MPPSFRFPPLREGNQATRLFGSLCLQGEPAGVGSLCLQGEPAGEGQDLFPPCFTRGTARHARSVPPALRQCIGRMDRLSINRLPPFAPLINGYPQTG
jgi:hypothetical protein